MSIGGFTAILIIITTVPISYDPTSLFIRSIFSFYGYDKNILSKKSRLLNKIPEIEIRTQFTKNRKPHIFLVMIESFNSRFIDARSENNIEFTPTFNQLDKKYLSLKKYFSNATYTAKGQFSALCGQVPNIGKSEFRSVACFQKKCVSEILKQSKYETTFFQADPNLDSENTRNFLLKNGFDTIAPISPPCSQDTEKCYGFGVKDEIFYDRVFKYAEKKLTKEIPQFIVMSTVATHMPFTFQNEIDRNL